MRNNKKKNNNTILYIVFSLFIGVFVFSVTFLFTNVFNDDVEEIPIMDESKEVMKVVFNKEVTSICVGETIKLSPTIYPASIKYNNIKWHSSNVNVARVSEDGTAKGINPGVTTITVSVDDKVSSSYYLIVNKDKDIVFVEDVTLNINEVTLEPNTSIQLIAKVVPIDATDQVLLWTSSNEKVAVVNQEGLVNAVGEGTAIISVVSHGGQRKTAVVRVKSKEVVPEVVVPVVRVLGANELFNKVSLTGAIMAQTSVFYDGRVVSSYSYNTNDNEAFPVSSVSKSILGIVASKMNDDGIINLDTKIDTYWHRANGYNYNTCTDEWRYYLGPEKTFKQYTDSKVELVENHASLRNCLTHSSTVKNMSMVHMTPGDTSSEYFGGGLSKTYGRAAFMLSHTYHQLFEKGGVPGSKTSYNYLKDELTREHTLAGFTMQIAMKESINEYLRREILNPLGCTSNSGFTNGNSIYFSTYYKSSANDLAKIIGMIANDGVANGRRILNTSAINNIERVESKLKNQTIAFDYIDGKYVKFGNYSFINGESNYKLSFVVDDYATYISYDPNKKMGFVMNVKFDSKKNKDNSYNLFKKYESYFYA